MSDVQKLAHEFTHGEEFLDGDLGFIQNGKGGWTGYGDDAIDEAKAFIAGFEAEPLDPAQRSNDFIRSIDQALPYGVQAVANALSRSNTTYKGRSTTQYSMSPADLKNPRIYAVPRGSKG